MALFVLEINWRLRIGDVMRDLISNTNQAADLPVWTHQRRIYNLTKPIWRNHQVCHCIKINNNKHVNRQSHVGKPTRSAVKGAEFSLIIGMSCWVQVFTFILGGSIGLWAGIQSAGEWVPQTPGFEILVSPEEGNLIAIACLSVSVHLRHQQQTCTRMYACIYTNVYRKSGEIYIQTHVYMIHIHIIHICVFCG